MWGYASPHENGRLIRAWIERFSIWWRVDPDDVLHSSPPIRTQPTERACDLMHAHGRIVQTSHEHTLGVAPTLSL